MRRLSPQALELSKVCSDKIYEWSNQVQPHGVILVLDPTTYCVTHVSANVDAVFTLSKEQVLGGAFLDWLDENSRSVWLSSITMHAGHRTRYDCQVIFKTALMHAHMAASQLLIMSHNGTQLCVELEINPQAQHAPMAMLGVLSTSIQTLGNYQGELRDFDGLICQLLMNLLGVERIYYLEFDTHGNGYVAAEALNGSIPSLLGHHFPHTDIPDSARKIYMNNRMRYFADTEALNVPLLSRAGDGSEAFDLTFSFFRPPASTHVQYLQNMGVRLSLSYSVIKEGVLVGLIGGHHRISTPIDYRTMQVGETLVRSYMNRRALLELSQDTHYLDEKRKKILQLIDALHHQHTFRMNEFFAQHYEDLCALMDANHCLMRYDGQVYLPPDLDPALAYKLFDLMQRHAQNFTGTKANSDPLLLSTDTLFELDAKIFPFRKTASGMMGLALDAQASNMIIWTRIEQVRDEKWAGNPSQAVQLDAVKGVGPRQSFDTWIYQVEGTSRPWASHTNKIAAMFRESFNQVLVNYFSSRDITTWKNIAAKLANAKEKAEQANESKSRFLSNMSHELRTPLHSMLGLSEAMIQKIETMPKEKQLTYLDLVRSSAIRLSALVNDLLDLAKLEAGMMQYHFARHDMRAIMAEACNETAMLAEKKRVEVVILSHTDDTMLVVDRQRMLQVIINLLSNAIKFTHEATTITLRIERREPNLLCLEVADEGIGIAQAERETIFDSFVQSSKTRSEAGGTGLGLSICREIVLAHQGRIWADTNAKAGASLFIELPTQLTEQTIDAKKPL